MEIVNPIRSKEKLDEMKSVLREQSYRNWFMFMLGLNTGLRISDILALKVHQVRDKTHIVLREKKTGKSKSFRINDGLRQIINDYVALMDSESFLIQSRKRNTSIKRQQAYRILTAAGEKVGISGEIGCHTMRKTFGYFFYKQFNDIALLQKIFNHSSPSITLTYIGINQDIQDAAIENFSL